MVSHLVKPNDKAGILVAIGSALLLGIYPTASRAAYADGANVVFVILALVFMRAFLLTSFCVATGKRLFVTKKDRIDAGITGAWQALTLIGVFSGLYYLQAPIVMIIVYAHTLMLLFYLAWKGCVKLTLPIIVSTVAAFVGLTFVMDLWSVQPVSNWIGIGMSFLAAIATVSRLYTFEHQVRDRNPASVGAECMIVAFVLLLGLIIWKMPVPPASLAGYGWVLLGALCVGIGTFGIFYGIALLGSFKYSLFLKMEPVFTTITSAVLLKEYLKLSQYVGIAIVLASLIAYQLYGAKKTEAADLVE